MPRLPSGNGEEKKSAVAKTTRREVATDGRQTPPCRREIRSSWICQTHRESISGRCGYCLSLNM
jgi:hypothetical protein